MDSQPTLNNDLLVVDDTPSNLNVDIQMPGVDGLEAIGRLRTDPAFASIPIIVLTALAMPGDRERCLKAGASEYLTKPVILPKLIEMAEALLRPH